MLNSEYENNSTMKWRRAVNAVRLSRHSVKLNNNKFILH